VATVVSVLCARVKVEEKWLIETLAAAGVPARPLPPTSTPLPIGPVPSGPLATTLGGGVEVPAVVVDRCLDRIVAGAIVPMLRAMGTIVIDGGLAATGNRLAVASALAAAGIPRPATLLATSEDAGMAAVKELGYPATLLPLDSGTPEIPLVDRDIAEAVLEHREVLGASMNAVSLIQAGTRSMSSQTDVLVIGGHAVCPSDPATAELAESAAAVLGASILGVTVSATAAGPVVWDVRAVPEFRGLLASNAFTISKALLGLIQTCLDRADMQSSGPVQIPFTSGFTEGMPIRREVTNDVVLSA
jgi:[lysine-biosynthesis-protein LysW]--L-2-aminoadipate ligase